MVIAYHAQNTGLTQTILEAVSEAWSDVEEQEMATPYMLMGFFKSVLHWKKATMFIASPRVVDPEAVGLLSTLLDKIGDL